MDLVWRRIRPFPPLAAVTQSLRDHCYLENQLLEMLAGWTLFTPETSVKIMLGEHLYEDAQHVDGLRARLLELRARQEDHTPSDELARLCEEIWKAPDTATRLAGAYLVLKPRLAESYFALARTTEPLVDAPTVRLLNQLGQQETRQVEEATRQLERLTVTLAAREAVETLVKRLGDRLESTGGIHSRGADRGSYSFKKAFPRGIVGAREKPFWYAADSSELPGFQPFTSHRGKILAMHTLLNGEIGTVERMAKIITEFPELPWAMRFALARQAWDEARHIGIVASAVRELGGEWGLYPFNCTIWKVHVDRPDPLERLALGNAKFEGQLCSQLRDWIGICRADGSDTLGEILDFLLADELPHVRNGKQWLPVVARNDPKRQQAVLAWADTQAAQLMDKFDATSAVREH